MSFTSRLFTIIGFSLLACQWIELPGNQIEVTVSEQVDSEVQQVSPEHATVDFSDSVRPSFHVPSKSRLNGPWRLEWDDEVGGTTTDYPHQCTIVFSDIDGTVSGRFSGPVAGRERTAIISGKLEGEGQHPVLVFQQREHGYVCSYQAIDQGGAILGVWHDTKNRSGDFRLLKHQ